MNGDTAPRLGPGIAAADYRAGVQLQNRYGDREFPVRDRWRGARAVRQRAVQVDRRAASRRSLATVGPAFALLVVLFILAGPLSDGVPETRVMDVLLVVTTVLFVIAAATGIVAGMRADSTLPRREQQAWFRLSGATDPADRQQQLLALDAQSDYAFGGWNSSLAYAPAWRSLPEPIRKREQERRGTRPRFVTMPVLTREQLRADLDQKFHLASASDVELHIADGLSTASLSARFHEILGGPDGERMVARVGSLTGTGEWDLRELDQRVGGLPPRLLWAADSQRAIGVARMAYLAEYLDEEESWRLIERAAAPASALFSDWDGYWANVRVGIAFLTDRLEAVQEFDAALEGLLGSAWPAAHVPFPSGGPLPTWLPSFPAPQRDHDPNEA